jgi:hypothetical protein
MNYYSCCGTFDLSRSVALVVPQDKPLNSTLSFGRRKQRNKDIKEGHEGNDRNSGEKEEGNEKQKGIRKGKNDKHNGKKHKKRKK